MKLEQQVVSLELAKKLKELGVRQESLFWWLEYNNGDTELYFREDLKEIPPVNCSAFTVAELGEMLGSKCESRKIGNEAMIKDGLKYSVYFEPGNGSYHKEYADTEADARAKMLIYLLENKLIAL